MHLRLLLGLRGLLAPAAAGEEALRADPEHRDRDRGEDGDRHHAVRQLEEGDDDGDIANDFMVLDGDGKDVNEGEERRYKQANVEIRGVSRGNLLLAPYTLD